MASNRSLALGIAAGAALAGSIAYIVYGLLGSGRIKATTQEWFYDLNTKQLFSAPASTVPPVAAPSGPLPDGSPAGVRAYVYGCENCNKSSRFIAYLEMFTAEGRAALETAHQRKPTETMLPMTPATGILVRRPDGTEWVERNTAAGYRIIADSLQNRCPADVFPQRCYP